MSNQALRERLYTLYAAYAAGDLDFVLNAFAEDVEFMSHAPVKVFPYLGRHYGKADVATAMRAAQAEFEFLAYMPVFVVAGDDSAAVIVFARLRQRQTGHVIQLMVADFLSFRDTLIVEFREFMDSFDVVQQLLGRELDTSK